MVQTTIRAPLGKLERRPVDDRRIGAAFARDHDDLPVVIESKHNPFGWRDDRPLGAILQISAAKSTFARCHAPNFTLDVAAGEGASGPGKAGTMRSQNFRGNVFVANLPPEISDEQLAEAFDAFGIVLSATVARDPATGKRLRYGFVDIATERAAKLAVESMNGAAIDGYNLDVRISERPVTAKKPRAAPGCRSARRAA